MERKKIEKYQLKRNIYKENNDLNKSYINNKESLIEKYFTPTKSPKKYNNNNNNTLLINSNSPKKQNKKYINNFTLTTPKKNLSPVKEVDDKNNDIITISTNTTTPIKNNNNGVNSINLKNYLRFNHDYYLTSAGKKKKIITMPYKTQSKIITKSSSTINMINKNLDNKFSKILIKNNSSEKINNDENNNINKSYEKNINNTEINNNNNYKCKTSNEKRKLINSLSLCYMLNTSKGNIKKNLDFKNTTSEKINNLNNNISTKNNIKSSRQYFNKNKFLPLLDIIDSENSSRSQSKDSKNKNKNDINFNNNNDNINNKKNYLVNSNLHLIPSLTKLSHNNSYQNFFKPIQNNYTNNNLLNINDNNYNNNDNSFITIEINVHDLLMVNDKFVRVMKTIESFNFYVISRSCYEFWNFYFNSSLKGNLNNYFYDINSKTEITKFNSLYLLSLILIYDLSFNEKIFNSSYKIIKKILMLIYNSYIIICNFFLIKTQNNTQSILINKLKYIIYNNNIIDNKKMLYDHNYFYENIQRNCFLINEQINLIFDLFHINNYSTKKLNPYTIKIYNNLQNYTSNDINKIFMTNILNIENKRGSVLFSNNFNNLQTKNILINEPPYKPLTLILDLDETLMSFEYSNKNEGISHIRPFLYEFLNIVHNYYEIIIFTAATQNYADPILDIIEKKPGLYFTYRLYRQHCSIYNNNFIKDISKIGRDLKYCIIVDNMSQNFKLQKDNGILIKSFWGDDKNDKALYELAIILKNIAIDMINSRYKKDIRELLWKFREEILKNVSMN